MTIRDDDFIIHWQNGAGTGEKPATYSEIIDAMDKINQRAAKAKPGDTVSITLRAAVAQAVVAGINNIGSGKATISKDDTKFIPERGGLQHRVLITQNVEVRTHRGLERLMI